MKSITTMLAAAAITMLAVPAMAQSEPEEARTTYAVTSFQFTDDADQNRWLEVMETYINPARVAAGMEPETIHWVMMNEDMDIILVAEVPGGMATFDSHNPPARTAFVAALRRLVGGEAQLEALWAEMDAMTENSHTVFSHTHP